MAAACEFPDELLTKPLGYVALTGLATNVNAMHLSVWDTFTVNRRQEKVLNIKLMPGDFEFPKRKQKRTSYEFYVPKGILKTYWLKKHLEILPALVVVFYDLDWNDPQWNEKQMECASRVAVIRSSLQGRNTKIAVVLIQKNMPLPPGEDPQAVQRAEALCQACELPSKSLFVLPFSDHLHGYVTRLEGAFYDIAQGYYLNEARIVKQHRELLNKSQHQLLFVRHQMKIAFFNELKQDNHLALKHYKQAYLYISEQKLTDVNNLEVKVVAGFMNYKICKICFQLNAPLDAISQFRKHIDFFKNKTGSHELAFEHSAWMAKQFSLFGDLFQEAIKNGLQAIQTQHPGFYYQQAANHSLTRRYLCQGLCRYSEPVTPDPLENAKNLEFFGQRPWRQGCQANEPPDPAMEQAGILCLQAQELTVDHSWIIIPLLGSAVTQFREYKSVRMKLFLMVQMGEEYYHAKDYGKALTLLNRVTPFYRSERWWSLLSSVLMTALKCAYLTATLKDFITISLELISKNVVLQYPQEKERIQKNLMCVMEQESPEPENGCVLESVESAKKSWSELYAAQTEDITIEMDSLAGFIECRVAFDADSFELDKMATLKVYLRSSGLIPFRFSELGVKFSNAAYNKDCVICKKEDGISENTIEVGQVAVYPFQFILSPEDVNKKLEVKQVYLRVSSNVVLCWQGAGLDANISASYDSSCYGGERLPVRVSRSGKIIWESVTISPFTNIAPRDANIGLEILHDAPSLVDELYPITIKIKNNESKAITNTRLLIKLQSEDETCKVKALLTTDSLKPIADIQSLEILCESLTLQDEVAHTVYLQSNEMGEKTVLVEVLYDMNVEVGDNQTLVQCCCSKVETLKIDTQMPFSVAVKIGNLRFKQINKINADEPFSLMTYVKCTSPWPLEISSSSFELSSDFKSVDKELYSQIANKIMHNSHCVGECQCLIAPGHLGGPRSCHIGNYIIEWKRLSSKGPLIRTKVNLPMAQIDFIPFYVKAEIQPYGCVEQAMQIKYTFQNRTTLVQKVEAAIEPNDSFMFSGNSQVQFRILPEDKHDLTYSLYPLVSGEVPLPRLHISLPQYYNLNCDAIAQEMLPTHIFVKPQPLGISKEEIQVI